MITKKKKKKRFYCDPEKLSTLLVKKSQAHSIPRKMKKKKEKTTVKRENAENCVCKISNTKLVAFFTSGIYEFNDLIRNIRSRKFSKNVKKI